MLNLLSDEILLMILSYFNVQDLNTVKCLSTRFANLAEDACLYRYVDLMISFNDDGQLDRYRSCYPTSCMVILTVNMLMLLMP